jgi:tRNA threonylcarbamoyl adenosine modification protein YeaZ
MILLIDTTKANLIKLGLRQGGSIIEAIEVDTNRNQAELLLPQIEKLLKKRHLTLKDLEAIEVANGEGSFSSLRLGIVTANALGYALGIPVQDDSGLAKKTAGLAVIDPIYDGEPNIGKK